MIVQKASFFISHCDEMGSVNLVAMPIRDEEYDLSDIYLATVQILPAPVPITWSNTKLLSRAEGSQVAGHGASNYPCISGSGNFVAFTSKAKDLDGDINQDALFPLGQVLGLGAVYRVDTATLEVELASRSQYQTDPFPNAAMSTADPTLGAVGRVISWFGEVVVFQGAPSNWTFTGLSGNAVEQVFVTNFLSPVQPTPRTDLVTQWFDDNLFQNRPGTGRARGASIASGSSVQDFSLCIALSSVATEYDPDHNATEDVFFTTYDLTGPSLGDLRKIEGFNGVPPNGASYLPVVDGADQHIAFLSNATNYTNPASDADGNQFVDVYLFHRDVSIPGCFFKNVPAGVFEECHLQLMTRDCADEQANAASSCPDVALDGLYVSYQSSATNLIDPLQDVESAPDTNGVLDVFQTGLKPKFVRGDVDQDSSAPGLPQIGQTDAIVILNWLFLGGPRPNCVDAADADDDGTVNVSDPSYLLNYAFSGGQAPAQPFPACGFDPTDDCLSCRGRDLDMCGQFGIHEH